MTNTKRKKTAKEKKILVASILLAAAITVGGTFAWFTSTDEVTNRLSASNSYGVSVTESFEPPSSWIPGQVVDKEVGAVNTGNVDAFVKMSLSNAFTVTTLDPAGYTYDASTWEANKDTLVELSTADPDEVQAIQAGGALVWEAGSAPTGDGLVDGVKYIESAEYTPTTAGLYVFRREINLEETSGEGEQKFEYAGYYYDGTSYYALQSITPTQVEGTTTGALTNCTATLQKTTTASYVNDDTEISMDYQYVEDEQNPRVVVTYHPAGTDATDGNIVINIKLNPDWETNWTLLPTDSAPKYFYYNQTLAAGATTPNLITDIEMDQSVKEEAYLEFDYDLTVMAQSVQVTEGDSIFTAVNEAWTDTTASGQASAVTWASNP